jgi:hypothetical protein
MEQLGYWLLGIVAVGWLIAVFAGIIATFPVGIIGLVAIIGIGVLFIKVLSDRMNSSEDDYYDKTVEK